MQIKGQALLWTGHMHQNLPGRRCAPVAVGRDGEHIAVVQVAGDGVSRRDALPHRQRLGHLRRRLVAIAHLPTAKPSSFRFVYHE